MLEFMDLIMPYVGGLLLVIFVMIGVAFLTLLERKLLGYVQLRKGPNKVGIWGIPQPFSDAIKLFTKEQTFPILSNYLIYYFSPIFSLFLSLSCWMVMPYFMKLFSFNFGILFFLCCLSMGVYGVMIAGWSSNSNYALLGGLRAIAQTISYEVSLVLLLLTVIFLVMSMNFYNFHYFQENLWFIFLYFPVAMVWMSTSLAETNRTPFDFAEGESELVSGFNVEYSSGGFSLIFLAEYSSILFMSFLFSFMFLGANLLSLLFYFKLLMISFLFIWVRGTLPRFRYDKLMNMCWKMYLPFSLNMLFFYMGLKIFLF